jgi:hypothetical protein
MIVSVGGPRGRPVLPELLDSLLDLYEFLDTPISLGRIFRRPRQLAIVLAIGTVLAGIAEYRRHTAAMPWPTHGVRVAETSARHAFV